MFKHWDASNASKFPLFWLWKFVYSELSTSKCTKTFLSTGDTRCICVKKSQQLADCKRLRKAVCICAFAKRELSDGDHANGLLFVSFEASLMPHRVCRMLLLLCYKLALSNAKISSWHFFAQEPRLCSCPDAWASSADIHLRYCVAGAKLAFTCGSKSTDTRSGCRMHRPRHASSSRSLDLFPFYSLSPKSLKSSTGQHIF
jgi:hypothetical protein